MAVQAQHPSNAFLPDHPSRVPFDSVLEVVQTMQSHQLQIDRLPSVGKAAGGLMNASLFSDLPQSELTCNVSGIRKRCRDELFTLNAPAAIVPPFFRVSKSAKLAASFALMNGSCGAVNTALLAPSDKNMRVFDSASASTSGRPTNLPIQSAPTPFSFGPEILAQVHHQNSEMDALIRLQNERIRLSLDEARKRHCRSLFSSIKQVVVKRIQQMEIELEEVNQKNAELEEKIQQLTAENQMWFNVAKNNEVLVSNLRTNLEQVLLQNAAAAASAAVPSLQEGYGDSDGIPLLALEAESFCFDDETRMAAVAPPTCMPPTANGITLQQMNCKVCGIAEVSVLVLPCQHLCLCQNCESSVAICPLCNYPKNASIQVIM